MDETTPQESSTVAWVATLSFLTLWMIICCGALGWFMTAKH